MCLRNWLAKFCNGLQEFAKICDQGIWIINFQWFISLTGWYNGKDSDLSPGRSEFDPCRSEPFFHFKKFCFPPEDSWFFRLRGLYSERLRLATGWSHHLEFFLIFSYFFVNFFQRYLSIGVFRTILAEITTFGIFLNFFLIFC